MNIFAAAMRPRPIEVFTRTRNVFNNCSFSYRLFGVRRNVPMHILWQRYFRRSHRMFAFVVLLPPRFHSLLMWILRLCVVCYFGLTVSVILDGRVSSTTLWISCESANLNSGRKESDKCWSHTPELTPSGVSLYHQGIITGTHGSSLVAKTRWTSSQAASLSSVVLVPCWC